MKKFVLLATLAALPALLSAQDKSDDYVLQYNQKLIEQMRVFERVSTTDDGTDDDVYEVSVYVGYIIGVHDMLATLGDVCVPKTPDELNFEVKWDQLAAVVTKYLRNHPETWHYAPSEQVAVAMMEAYPCQHVNKG